MYRRLLVLFTLVLTLALSLTGCGGGGDDNEPTPQPTAASAPAAPAGATSAPTAAAAEPTRVPPAAAPTAAQRTAAAQPTMASPTEASDPTAAPGKPAPTTGPSASGSGEAEPEIEPNDNAAQATVLTAGAWEGALAEGDMDWFELPVPAGALVDLGLSPANNNAPLSIAVYNANNSRVWSESSVAKGETGEFSWIEGPGDTFRIEISEGPGDYTLTVELGAQDDAGSGADAGGSLTEATAIESTESVQGLIGDSDLEDWYALAVPDGSVLEVAFTPDADAEDLAVLLQDPDRNDIWAEYDISGRGRALRWVVSGEHGGPYAVQVLAGRGSYTLDIETTLQDDGSIGTDAPGDIRDAAEVSVEDPIVGVVGNTDAEDWYLFSVDPGTVLTVDLAIDPSSDEVNAYLYDPDENNVWSEYDISPRQGASLTRLISAESSGDYILGVGGTGVYTATIAVVEQDDAGSGGDAGEEIQDAVEVEVGEEYTGLQGGSDWTDWYVVTLEEGQSVTIILTPDDGDQTLFLTVYDAEENEIETVYDVTDTQAGEVVIEGAVEGEYHIQVGDGQGGYTLTVEE